MQAYIGQLPGLYRHEEHRLKLEILVGTFDKDSTALPAFFQSRRKSHFQARSACMALISKLIWHADGRRVEVELTIR